MHLRQIERSIWREREREQFEALLFFTSLFEGYRRDDLEYRRLCVLSTVWTVRILIGEGTKEGGRGRGSGRSMQMNCDSVEKYDKRDNFGRKLRFDFCFS